jgi:hypothetical protein
MLDVVQLEEKGYAEKIQYQFDLKRFSPFANNEETISSVAFNVYGVTDTLNATNLNATFVSATDFDANVNKHLAKVEIAASVGSRGSSYHIVGFATCSSGRIYQVVGRFSIKGYPF